MALAPNAAYAADEKRWSALMVSAQAGDEADYRCLLGELSDVIMRYLSSRIGFHHFLDDCAQETLIAIHQARHTYDSNRKFRPWLFAIVRHKAIDALRKERSQHNAIASHTALERPEVGAEQLENSIMSGRLVNSLSDPYRQAITLTKIVGLSTAEAAAQLSISEGALKVRIHRAITQLRRMMEADTL
ncbi:MAG: RNA polymerase sigma-70 factor (ECF subfamily) [Halioglobus sp.]|jgi:RNA polymerase sigma-70 factor (ECF subfamily)